jgi:predicted amidophosphoribosyltransferase
MFNTRKRKNMNEVTYSQDSLTLTNVCPECIAQETLCVDCVETADARLTDIVYEAASEGNLQYKAQWLVDTEPSGHDWTDREGEYKLPIVLLQDGGELDNIWSLDDYTQSQREVICPSCHLTTPKMFNQCQCCDAPLEHNVISISLMKEISRFVN